MRGVFQGAVSSIFSAMGDIVESATYTSLGTSTYNPVTRTTSSTDETAAVDVILDEYGAVELRFSERLNDDQSIIPGDKKCLVKASDLSGITPKVLDTITLSDGIAWQIKAIKIDPAMAMYIFQIRRP